MATTRTIDLGEFNIGSTDRIRATITKDEVAWAGIDSVALTFEKPDRVTQFTVAMVLENDAAGIWYYDTTTSEIDSVGYWKVRVQVTDGAVVKRYPYEIGFFVSDQA